MVCSEWNNLMIDNMPQQNSLFLSCKAFVLIPVWKTGERDRGGNLFIISCHFASGQRRAQDSTWKMQEAGKHETKTKERGNTWEDRETNRKEWKEVEVELGIEGGDGERNVPCGKTLKPVRVRTRFPDWRGGSLRAKQRGGEPKRDTQAFQPVHRTKPLEDYQCSGRREVSLLVSLLSWALE